MPYPRIEWPRQENLYSYLRLIFTVVAAGWVLAFLLVVGRGPRAIEAMLNQATFVVYHLAIFPAGMAFYFSTRRFAQLCDPPPRDGRSVGLAALMLRFAERRFHFSALRGPSMLSRNFKPALLSHIS